jgi:hypothetical protein
MRWKEQRINRNKSFAHRETSKATNFFVDEHNEVKGYLKFPNRQCLYINTRHCHKDASPS